MNSLSQSKQREAGFSLFELVIAMGVTLAIMAVASTLLAGAFKQRASNLDTIDALADAQRALNIMSREIADAGFNLTDNGIVEADSVTDANGNSTIRVRANLNKFDLSPSISDTARNGIGVVGQDAGEDIKYFIYPTTNTSLLARYDAYAVAGGNSTVLANRLDGLHIHYFSQYVTYSTSGCDITSVSAAEVTPSAAKYVVIAVCVGVEAVGSPGSPGYQPGHSVLLVSDVALRNSNLTT